MTIFSISFGVCVSLSRLKILVSFLYCLWISAGRYDMVWKKNHYFCYRVQCGRFLRILLEILSVTKHTVILFQLKAFKEEITSGTIPTIQNTLHILPHYLSNLILYFALNVIFLRLDLIWMQWMQFTQNIDGKFLDAGIQDKSTSISIGSRKMMKST